jgi:hypothetical protein
VQVTIEKALHQILRYGFRKFHNEILLFVKHPSGELIHYIPPIGRVHKNESALAAPKRPPEFEMSRFACGTCQDHCRRPLQVVTVKSKDVISGKSAKSLDKCVIVPKFIVSPCVVSALSGSEPVIKYLLLGCFPQALG